MPDDKKAIAKSRREARKIMEKIYPGCLKGKVVHHIDCNPFNNDINNLCVLHNDTHFALHWDLEQSRQKAENSRLNNFLDRGFQELDTFLTAFNPLVGYI